MSVISVQDQRIGGGVSTGSCLPAGGFSDNLGFFSRGVGLRKPWFCAVCGA